MKLKKFNLEYEPYDWFLRSACSYYNYSIGYIYSFGDVYDDFADSNNGMFSVCIII